MPSPNLVSRDFTDASAPKPQRARIDGRTAGFPAEDDPKKTSWRGMSPAPGKSDGWYVLVVDEESNEFLRQVNKDEALVKISRVIAAEDGGPMTFEKAVEYLAVWEMGQVARGTAPVEGQDRKALGKHYYKNILLSRGLLVDTTGTIASADDIFPNKAGKFLKSDLEALEQYRDGLKGENILNELINSHDALFISETTLEEDLQSFGEIALFDKMQLFTEVLVAYARVKLQQVQDFYADPTKPATGDLSAALASDPYFGQGNIDRFNAAREELFGSVFRYFHVAQADWNKELNLKDRDFQRELLVNPDAKRTYDHFDRKIGYPLTTTDIDSMLFVAARSLYYFREKMKESPQKDLLERKGVYKQGDIDDLLNYLNLLDIKYKYKELAEAAIALPGTQRAKELDEKKQAFLTRVQKFKDSVKSSQDYSPAMEKQIDAFVRSSAPIYLIDRIAGLPEKITKAQQFIKDRLLPKPPAKTGGAPTP
jgi:hypothetical protein